MHSGSYYPSSGTAWENRRIPYGYRRIYPETSHHLIEAFKSTLEEAKYADVIIHVVDAFNPQMDQRCMWYMKH